LPVVEYWWRYGAGPDRSSGFADQSAAESWLSASFGELRDRGVESVTLLVGEDEVYGPMSLDPAD